MLFVDHFHRLLGGEERRYPIDAANLLVPALARREIQIIGACTLAQYRQHIERFAAIEFRLQAICIESDDESEESGFRLPNASKSNANCSSLRGRGRASRAAGDGRW